MSNIIIHLVKENDTFELIQKKYNVSEFDLLRLNPIIRNKYLYLGQVLYVLIDSDIINISLNDKHYHLIEEILFYIRSDFISYHNNYNDHFLIENKLFNKFTLFIEDLFSQESKIILIDLFKDIHFLLHDFYTTFETKDNLKMNDIKNSLKEIIISLEQILKNNNINLPTNMIKTIIENFMMMISKIKTNNYLDAFNINEENLKILTSKKKSAEALS